MQLDEPRVSEPAPVGTHLAILVKLVDLGWQDNTFLGETKRQRQAILTWELPKRLNSFGRPFLVSKTMNMSLHEKATLRGWCESLAGRTFTKADLFGASRFDVKHLLGKTCLLKVEHTEKEGVPRAKVAGLVPVPEGLQEPAQVTESVYFSLAPGEFDEVVFETLSPWAKEKITASSSYSLAKTQTPVPPAPKVSTEFIGDEIPF